MGYSVAIIGLGPKGLYCLERLCAEQKALPLDAPLTVHVFDRSGCSPIYDPTQPDHILVNVSVGEIDLWDVDDPPPAAGRGPSFVTWYADTFGEQLTGDEYLPRSVVGRYLCESLGRILEHVPEGMTVQYHGDEVIDIDDGYRVRTSAGEFDAGKILLATGHARLMPGPEEQQYAESASRNPGAMFIPFVYPVTERMRPVPAGARVAMLGIGLTFIDALLELTEGRGGRFVRDDGDTLRYERSGNEPDVIFPFSRTGLPMAPKSNDLPLAPRPLKFVTVEALEALRRTKPDGQLDFERDVLPLFERELNGFDYRAAIDPDVDSIESYMEETIASAKRGSSPISVWYEARIAINSILRFGGFTPESHRALIEYYFPRFKRVVFGPPVINAEKLLALTKAGIVDFAVSRSPVVDGFQIGTERVDVLIDARFPKTDIARDASPLYRNLCRRGMIRPFRNRSYAPGAIDMTEDSQYVIDAAGNPNEDIAVIGIPTEGNFVGNLTIGRDPFAGRWARGVMGQMRGAQRAVGSAQRAESARSGQRAARSE